MGSSEREEKTGEGWSREDTKINKIRLLCLKKDLKSVGTVEYR